MRFQLDNATAMQFNVQCDKSGATGMGPNGLNIVMKVGAYDASLAYYTNPRMASSFYDLRPVAGAVTHWDYAKGQPIGAYGRFRDVILNGVYPKIGPAATAWKTWYDPKNEIRS